jgi:hypothetical protein
VRPIVLLTGAALLLPGCQDDRRKDAAVSTLRATPPAHRATPARRPHAHAHEAHKPAETFPAQYEPSAHHATRPRGSVYGDEVGENVLIAPYRRIIQVFGPPASRHGKCIDYRIVDTPSENWEFCFKGQKMDSAMVIHVHP